MNKFTIAVDVDNVINDLIKRTIDMYNQRRNTSLNLDDINHYNIYKILPIEEANEFCKLFREKQLWDSLSPAPKSQWGIKKLVDTGYNVVFATATDPINFPWKVDWIEHLFPFVNTNNIVCIQDKSLLAVDVLVDDCLDNLLCSQKFYRVCLDFPWNRDIHDEVYSIYRTFDWEDIVNTINEIYKEDSKYLKEEVI